MRTGSAGYPGAAVLSVSAAWRTGVGLLRYAPPLGDELPEYGLTSPAAAVLAAHPETVFGAEPGGAGRPCDAWVIGSGTNPAQRSDAEHETLLRILRGAAPVAVDAGALGLVFEREDSRSNREPATSDPAPAAHDPSRLAPAILTPHRGEFLRLWNDAGLGARPTGWPARGRGGRERTPSASVLRAAALEFAATTSTTVLLKGSSSVVATPGGRVYLTGPATPWLATAGTGDVLGGILGALLATHASVVREDPEALGALGATAAVLHDAAARFAARAACRWPGEGGENHASVPASALFDDAPEEPSGGPITAKNVAEALPAAVAALRSVRVTARRAHR